MDDKNSDVNRNSNKKFQKVNHIAVKRKRKLLESEDDDKSGDKILSGPKSLKKKKKSDLEDNNGPQEERLKNSYMESFDLRPCVVTLEPLPSNWPSGRKSTEKNETTVKTDKITKHTKDSDASLKITDINKKLVDNEKDATNETNDNVCVNRDFVIDETNNENTNKETTDNSLETECHKDNNVSNNSDSVPNILEPEVLINEDLEKSVIEINELDDSDVEITSYQSPKRPQPKNKKSLESIIKDCKFQVK